MHELVEVRPADLLLDEANARLGDEQPSQAATQTSLARQQGHRLVVLCKDVVENGLDPLSLTAVVATGDEHQKYRVIEGNRRLLALKALDTPTTVSAALTPADLRALTALSEHYQKAPIPTVTCVLFETFDEANHWVNLRHTGSNEGAGLVEWDSDEKDRYRARHGQGQRKPSGQVLDFLTQMDGPGAAGQGRFTTTLQRLIATPAVRSRLGLDIVGGQVLSRYPAQEVAKGLRRVVGDLREGKVNVTDVYYDSQRRDYIDSIPAEDLPDPRRALPQAAVLTQLPTGGAQLAKAASTARPRTPRRRPRTAVIPRESKISPSPPRLKDIANELRGLDLETTPNACAVLLRVFLELSVDHELDRLQLAPTKQTPLALRLKLLADDMHSKGRIDADLRKVVHRIADKHGILGASTSTFNQYVHNRYALPSPQEVRIAWDELQPFMERIWP